MAKKVTAVVKLQLTAAKASPGPPVGPALGQYQVDLMGFTKAFNDRTADQAGTIIPVVVTVYEDRSYTFVCKTPPAAVLLRQAAGLDKGSGEPNKTKIGKLSRDKVREIAMLKMVDLNAADIEAAMRMIEGTAKSMGLVIQD